MFILKKIGCRAFQMVFRAALPILPYREPKVVSSCTELSGVFAKEKTASAHRNRRRDRKKPTRCATDRSLAAKQH